MVCAQHFWRKTGSPIQASKQVSLPWEGQLFSLHGEAATLQMVSQKRMPSWCGEDFRPAGTVWIRAQVAYLNKSSE